MADIYCRVLQVEPAWLLYGRGEAPGPHHDEAVRDAAVADANSGELGLTNDLAPAAYVPIEVLPTFVGMGGGGTGEGESITALLPRELVQDQLHAKPSELLMIDVRGNSMEPHFFHGDQLLIDKRDRDPVQPGPFALWDGDGYVVKNIERVGGRYRIFSSNAIYSERQADPEEITIMGRPVWFARRL